MLINHMFSGKSLKAKVLASLTIFSLLAPSLLPIQAIANNAPVRACSIEITSVATSTLTFVSEISGTATCVNALGSGGEQYQVRVDWGDGNVSDTSIVDFTAGKDFSGTWSNSHDYGTYGLYDVTVSLYHQKDNENDADDPSDGVEIKYDVLDYGDGPVVNAPPVITLIGANPTSTPQNSTYTDEGATATDVEDGALSPSVFSNNVNTAVIGSYEVVYSVTDTGSLTDYATRTVDVVAVVPPPANTAPVITFFNPSAATGGAAYANIPLGSPLWDDIRDLATWRTATDNEDGDITNSITGFNRISTAATGTYLYIFRVNDSGVPSPVMSDYEPRAINVYDQSNSDNDSDGVANDIDNCPFVANPSQANADSDGLGDACDNVDWYAADMDGDGVLNQADNCPFFANGDSQPVDMNDSENPAIFGGNNYCMAQENENFGTAYIQGRKYRDVNQDGKFNPSEKNAVDDVNRINNWSISLYASNWTLLDTMLTASTTSHSNNAYAFGVLEKGQYRFGNLAAGTYYVCEADVDGWKQTSPSATVTDIDLASLENISSVVDPNNAGQYCYQVTLTDGQEQKTVRFGNIEAEEEVAYSISGYKFNDINADGNWDPQNDPAEGGLGGWTITLAKKVNGPLAVSSLGGDTLTPVLSSLTDYFLNAFGTYDAADSITADAQYSVRSPNTDWTDSVQNYEIYGPTLLDLQVNDVSVDWGNYNDTHSYWLPVTGSGSALALSIYDIAPENNTGDLSVAVYEVIGTTVTEEDGSYSFGDLELGDYIVRESNQPGWVQTYPEGDGVNHVTLTAEEDTATNVNFGNDQDSEIEEGTACGYKFHDLNGDGVWDQSEPALEGIEMELYEMNGDAVDTTRTDVTDENGRFCFEISNAPGENILGEEENGWMTSVGLPQTLDVENTSASYEFANVGNYQVSTVGGLKWLDTDGDANRDEGETDLANWTITLTNLDTDAVVSTTTDESGDFTFNNVAPGNYRVAEEMQGGYAQTYPVNSGEENNHPNYYDITVVSDSEVTNLWFGNDTVSEQQSVPEEEEDEDGGGGGSSGSRPNPGNDDEGGGGGGNGGGQPPVNNGGNPGFGQGGAEGGLALLGDGDVDGGLALGDDATTTASTTDGIASTTDDNTNQLAAVGALGGLFGISWWWWILILILLGIIGYYTFRDKNQA